MIRVVSRDVQGLPKEKNLKANRRLTAVDHSSVSVGRGSVLVSDGLAARFSVAWRQDSHWPCAVRP